MSVRQTSGLHAHLDWTKNLGCSVCFICNLFCGSSDRLYLGGLLPPKSPSICVGVDVSLRDKLFALYFVVVGQIIDRVCGISSVIESACAIGTVFSAVDLQL